MSKKKGRWVKRGKGEIIADGKIYTDGEWKKVRKKPKTPEVLTSQQEKMKEVGQEIKIECTGKKGSEFSSCRSKVLEKVFGKNDSQD